MSTLSIAVSLDSKVIERKKLNQEIISIGREIDNDITINNLAVSRYHALIYHKNGRILIKDLGSANGTYLNGVKLVESNLHVGDIISIGKYVIKIYIEEADSTSDAFFHSDGRTIIVNEETTDKFLNRLKVDQSEHTAKIIVSNGNQYNLNVETFLIGKNKVADLNINGVFIRDFHAKIINQNNGRYKLVSRSSFFRPTKVNGVKVKERILNNGDIIQIGNHYMVVSF